MEINGIVFKDLEKNLRKLGIDIITIRHSTGDVGCEIEGYFNPSVYKKYVDDDKPITLTKTRTLTPVVEARSDLEVLSKGFKIPKIKKDGKWHDLAPEKVIFSGPATTILWKDGTKTTVKCQDKELYDEDTGVAMCYLKKMLGNEGNFNNIFREAAKVTEVR